MAAADIISIWDRLHAILSGDDAAVRDELNIDFRFRRCDDPFTFDRAPRQTYSDGVYRIEAEQTGDPGRYIGGGRNERHRVNCWVLRPNRGPKTDAAYKKLLVDLDKLRNAFEHDGDEAGGPDYYVMDSTVSSGVQSGPSAQDIWLVGRLSFTVDFDRDDSVEITGT